LPPAFEKDAWKRTDFMGNPTWSVALWFIALLFLLLWSAFLAWRWRRMRRAARLHGGGKPAWQGSGNLGE
jgi:hypothetical protein